MVFCTEFVDGWWSREQLRRSCVRCGSQDHYPSKNSVQKTICCNSTPNVPDDGRMYPKHVELRIHQLKSLHFILLYTVIYEMN